jgi:hypothetical protein
MDRSKTTKSGVERSLKWEYKVIDLVQEVKKESNKKGLSGYWLRTSDLERILNKLGAKGWELVNVHFLLDSQEAVVMGLFKRSSNQKKQVVN